MATASTQETGIATNSDAKMRLQKIKEYTKLPDIQERFQDLLGEREGMAYLSAVYIAVMNSEKLQECSPRSIMIQAMRAASLKLSVDPTMKQAHLVPYGNNAQLIVDYHGLVLLMERTGLYSAIHVSEVFEGEIVEVDRFSGKCRITGTKKSEAVIGWMAYFRTHKGIERFLYMTNEECDAHGKKYSKAFNSPKSGWQTDRDAMRRKTALRCLCNKWGQYSPFDTAVLKNAEDIVDVDGMDLPEPSATKLPAPAPRDPQRESVLKEQGLGMDVYRADSPEVVGAVADEGQTASMDEAQAWLFTQYAPSDMLSIQDAKQFARVYLNNIQAEQTPLISE